MTKAETPVLCPLCGHDLALHLMLVASVDENGEALGDRKRCECGCELTVEALVKMILKRS